MPDDVKIKKELCDIGDRLYRRGFAAANDGNISYRLADDRVLCTPTLICKGFMKPADLCIVDLDGNQVKGNRKRTSEILLHLEIMKKRPEMRAVVHCHPPYATAFGITRRPLPQHVLPEVELFLGDVPIAPYALPGTSEFARTVDPFVHTSNAVILAHHGTVSYAETLEKAFWLTEILESYCRILHIASGLGEIRTFSDAEVQALQDLKQKWAAAK